MNPRPPDTALRRLRRKAVESPFFASLRTRLMALVLLAVLPALGLIIFTAMEQRELGVKEAKAQALRVARMATAQHDRLIEGARQLLLILAQLDAIQDQDAPTCQELFSNLARMQPVYANIGALRANGEIFASSLAITNLDRSDRDYYQNATSRLDFVLGAYRIGPITGKPVLTMAYPVRTKAGELRGVVYASLDLNWLKDIVTNAPPNTSMTVVDGEHLTLARVPDPENKFTGHKLEEFYPDMRQRPPSPRSRELGERVSTIPRLSRDGTWRLYASVPLEHGLVTNKPARVSIGIPLAVAYADANRILRRNLLFLGVVMILALAAAWFGGSAFILRQIRALVDVTQRLSQGELSARTGITTGEGELHQLARAFDQMAQSLQDREAERDRALAQLKGLNEDLERRVAARTLDLKRSNEDLQQFAYVASHDLQEPLRMVSTYVQLLRQRYESQLDNNAREFIGFAVDGAQRMQQLIQDLLLYSRVGTRGQPAEPTQCNDIVDRVLTNLKVAIEESGAVIKRDALPAVMGDGAQLTQLFQNLLSNAIKFRSDHPPAIHIAAAPAAAAPGGPAMVQFSVRDNGIGIAAQDFDRIFVLFQRLHGRQKYPGTGLGLSICKKIVERHGGRIWVESELGKGAIFHFTLPAPTASELHHGTAGAS